MHMQRIRSDSEASDNSCASNNSTKRKLEDLNSEITIAKRNKSMKTTQENPMAMTSEQKLDLLIQQNSTLIDNVNATKITLVQLQKDVADIKVSQKENARKIKQIDKEILSLKAEIATLSTNNNKLQQNSLSRDIVIFGLPAMKREQMPQIISALSTASAFPLAPNDFMHIYPITQKDKSKCTIHAKFHVERQKIDFVESLRQRKLQSKNPLLAEDIMQLANNDPRRGTEIVVRSKLTSMNRTIINEARNQKSKIKYAWEKDGRILIRQTDAAPIIEIHSMSQLMDLLNPIHHKSSNEEQIQID